MPWWAAAPDPLAGGDSLDGVPPIHRYDQPDRFVAGTVGLPGQRTFFLQAREGNRLTSVALEKEQVAVLAERVDSLLDQVMTTAEATEVVPAIAPPALEDSAPLDQPIEEEFRAGTMTLAWDPESHRVVIEVFAVEAEDLTPDGEPSGEALVVSLTPAVARAFCKRAQSVVEAGRPPCQFCGGPLDPSGHLCPRANGFRRR